MALIAFGARRADMFDPGWGFGELLAAEPVPVAASPLQVELSFPDSGCDRTAPSAPTTKRGSPQARCTG